MKKSLFLGVVFFAYAGLSHATGNYSQPINTYYSDAFVQDVNDINVKDKQLRASILTTFQRHTSIGYGNARVFLMGKFYLVQETNHFGVKDVYCSREIMDSEFPAGKTPAPNKIPDDSIINTEHTWPQSRFNSGFNKEMQKSDLHHLFPTDSKINNIRANYKFGEVQHDAKSLKCQGPRFGTAEAGSDLIFEPPQIHKGNVARAIFYFSIKYNLSIDPNEEATLRRWNKADPVDDEEMSRNTEIEKVQHSRNPFVDFPELSDRIGDF